MTFNIKTWFWLVFLLSCLFSFKRWLVWLYNSRTYSGIPSDILYIFKVKPTLHTDIVHIEGVVLNIICGLIILTIIGLFVVLSAKLFGIKVSYASKDLPKM